MFQITDPHPAVHKTPVLVTYEVCQPNIFIHTPTSTTPILCIPQLLYIDVIVHSVICMHNSSNVSAYFLWGKTVGKQKDCIQLVFNPNAGCIKPRDTFKVTVTLKPRETGILEEIFVPCFVGRVEEPTMLAVMCAVDNVHVRFDLPVQEGEPKKVFWPPKIVEDYGSRTYGLDNFSNEESYCFTDEPKKFYLQDKTSQSNTDRNDDVGSIKEIELPTLLSLGCPEQTPEVFSEKSVNVQKGPLAEYFGPDLILEDYHLEIPQIPIKTRNTIIIFAK